jgi:hypothetical protein
MQRCKVHTALGALHIHVKSERRLQDAKLSPARWHCSSLIKSKSLLDVQAAIIIEPKAQAGQSPASDA